MAVNYLAISVLFFFLSFFNFIWWSDLSLKKMISHAFSSDVDRTHKGNAAEFLMESYLTVALVANFVISFFILIALSMKSLFFGELYISESRKLKERLINYIIYKGGFLPLVVPPTIFQAGLWLTWLLVVSCLKMFQALGRDRLESMNACPSALPWEYLRVFLVLPFVLVVDMLWMRLCLATCRSLEAPMPLFLFFEPLSILFETMQAILVHGFQLLEIWIYHSPMSITCLKAFKIFGISSPGCLSEWKGIMIQNWGFYLEIFTLLMALGHYVNIWWLQGTAFHFMDVVLFLNIRALITVIIKKIKVFIRFKRSLGTLHRSFPDATKEDLRSYNDECAICKEPMARAKKLCCNHLFHLACLRSWLDQGSNELYSCPTCRKPFSMGRTQVENLHSWDYSQDGDLNVQMNMEHGQPSTYESGRILPSLMFDRQTRGAWSGTPRDWRWPGGRTDGAGSSQMVSMGRVHMMMRQLAAVGETYAQNALHDGPWNLFPAAIAAATADASTSLLPPPTGSSGYSRGGQGGLHLSPTHSGEPSVDDMSSIFAMVETVQEVLPHIPHHQILQDVRMTNSAVVTVNNLLQM